MRRIGRDGRTSLTYDPEVETEHIVTCKPRAALVTGAASGIGAAIAQRLIQDGAVVIASDRDADGLTQLNERNPDLRVIALDLADPDAIDSLDASAHLPTTLDVVVNCAGVYAETSVETFDRSAFQRILDVNVTAAAELTARMVPRLRRSDAPRVVNISSIQDRLGEAQSLAYGVSKAGLSNATRVLAVALGRDGILVNAIAPGFITTPMSMRPDGSCELDDPTFHAIYIEGGRLPLGRAGRSEEVAEVARFLLSPANTYLTGQVIAVDGGLTSTF